MKIQANKNIVNNFEIQAKASFIFRGNGDRLYSAADPESPKNFCQKIFDSIKNFFYWLCCPKSVRAARAELAIVEARAAREREQYDRNVAEAQQNADRNALEERQEEVNSLKNHLERMERRHREHLITMAQGKNELYTAQETGHMQLLKMNMSHDVMEGQMRGADPAQLNQVLANRKPAAIQRLNELRDAALLNADQFRNEHEAFYQQHTGSINEMMRLANQHPAEFPNRQADQARANEGLENCRRELNALSENLKEELRNRYRGYIAEIENLTALDLIRNRQNQNQRRPVNLEPMVVPPIDPVLQNLINQLERNGAIGQNRNNRARNR